MSPDNGQTAPRGEVARLIALAKPHRGALVAGVAVGLVGAAAALAQPLIAARIIRALADDRSLRGPLTLLVVLVLLGAVAATISAWLLERSAENIVRDARRSLASRLLRLQIGAIDGQKSGDLISRVTSDTTYLRAVAIGALDAGITATITLVVAAVLMAFVDFPLFLTTLVVLAATLALIGIILPRIVGASKRSQDAVGEIGAALQRSLGAIRTVKAAGAERRETQSAVAATDRAAAEGRRLAWLQATTVGISGLALQSTFLAVLGVGGARVANGSMDVADLIAFLLFLFNLSGPIVQIVSAIATAQSGRASLQRIAEVEALPIEEDAMEAPTQVHPGASLVSFAGVDFRYHGAGPQTLTDVSFTIPPRGLTAIVGPSGGGKTTIFSLLERFYDPSGGAIRFDGHDVTEVPRDWLRTQIGYVEQDAPVLDGTLRENLLFAQPDADDDALAEAIRDASLDEMVVRLPEGLDTQVGERGITLSGGQRQRVAIARALLRRPRLLLLDEATAQLDATNEQLLRDVVERVSRSHSVIAIAHRLSTVAKADQILVVVDGRIHATGTHDQLVLGDPIYRSLATTQLLTV